jgi:hypothetical protein
MPERLLVKPIHERKRANGHCFYCDEKTGTPHKDDCVCVCRKVRVRLTIEYEIDAPAAWDKAQVEFHRNHGSWCANNALSELDEYAAREDVGCLCGSAHTEVLSFSAERFVRD